MSDLLIKNIELPKDGSITVTVYSDMVWCDLRTNEYHGEVQIVSPHGRLVDIDRLIRRFRLWGMASVKRNNVETADLLEDFAETDTVLEASE